jgi:DNA-binding PadR family transcriptional regulator
MKPSASLGEFEQVVLLAILRLDKQAYGVTIRSEIALCTGREPAPGALYTTLDRMQEKGIVRSWFGEATPQRGGRPKRYFALTKAGRAALVNAQRAYQSLLDGLDLLGEANA